MKLLSWVLVGTLATFSLAALISSVNVSINLSMNSGCDIPSVTEPTVDKTNAANTIATTASTTTLQQTASSSSNSAAAAAETTTTTTTFPNLERLGQKLLSDSNPQNDWERNLFARLDRIREHCGELCAINDLASLERYTVTPKNQTAVSMRQLKVPVDCDSIMLDAEIDASDNTIPSSPPPQLLEYYTMGNATRYNTIYKNQTYAGTTGGVPVWSQDLINEYTQKIKNMEHNDFRRGSVGYYGRQSTHLFLRVRQFIPIKGARVLVIGSESPWLEVAALYLGAAHVVTLEYGIIQAEDPRMTTYLPSEFRELYRNKTLGLFDVVLSFSSLEHSGLGRYGDALNPWGDVLAVARARCVTRPGGYLGISVPVPQRSDKLDIVSFNELREYGKIRYPLLTANWEQLDGEEHRLRPTGKRHPPFVFVNPID